MGIKIGIDLGTTNSAAAIVQGKQPRIIDSKEAKPQIRSVVGLRRSKRKGEVKEQILVGDIAVDNWENSPQDTIVSIKRLMGRGVADPVIQRMKGNSSYQIIEPSDGTKDSIRVVMGGDEYSPIEISSMILKKIKEDVEFKVGETVDQAVITCPAYFGQIQKQATRLAGELAGMKVIKVLDEPTAAAIAFGIDALKGDEAKTILVYDLGGGTFDISVLMMAKGAFAQINLEGDMWLGGDDFDQVLVDKAVEWIKGEYDLDPIKDHKAMVRLKKKAKEVKEQLSASLDADFIVSSLMTDENGNLVDVDFGVTRDEYEAMIDPMVDRTLALVDKSIANANLTDEHVDHILMAGGSTGIPLIHKKIEARFGPKKILRNIHPKHCVAYGASIFAAVSECVFCTNPDPENPKDVCDHPNPEGATVCERCDGPLEVIKKTTEPKEPTVEKKEEEQPVSDEITFGPISGELPYIEAAPYFYGALTSGGGFAVFVRKGDPCPTQDPETKTFTASSAEARMIAIPIYGRDSIENPELDEKQGIVFAVLPPNPKRKPFTILVTLKLLGTKEFKVNAQLEDGRPLHPWRMIGEKDQKAMEIMQQGEEEAFSKRDFISPDVQIKLNALRDKFYAAMEAHDFEKAMEIAEELLNVAKAITQGPTGIREKLMGIVGYTEFLLHRYDKMMDPDLAYQLNKMKEDGKHALESGDEADMQTAFEQLDATTDRIPQHVQMLLGMRMAIARRVRPIDVATAANFEEKLNEAEEMIMQENPMGLLLLKEVTEELSNFIETHPEPEDMLIPCPHPGCKHMVRADVFFCPDGHPVNIVKSSSSSFSG
ncbi:MAG TPA: Hsp70 family protein [Acidobacteriota bacterium]|nr:Hsp70 family protein [Acidobacteriota bacterium]